MMPTGAATARAASADFVVTFDVGTRPNPFSGRVYLFFDPAGLLSVINEPRQGPNWFQPQPFVSRDVENWNPGEPLTIDLSAPDLHRFPHDLQRDQLVGKRVQAVIRFNPLEREVGTGPGNGFSQVVAVPTRGTVALTVDRLVPTHAFQETTWTKLFRVRSELLSRFHGRDVFIQAAVTLPRSYADAPEQRYPVILEIPGFGGTHRDGIHQAAVEESNPRGIEFLRVMLDPSCPLGHHCFANSANNGPWGDALVQEFLPALDARYRTRGEPGQRFLTGHSSGGWSSLWLQTRFPDDFGGTWSTSPDPVDFRDFQRIDLVRPDQNMYVDAAGSRRPLARMGGRVIVYYDTFAHMEDVLGFGGQLHSFEAVFSPRLPNGTPRLLWDRKTGAIDPQTAMSWRPYDIRRNLEENWAAVGPRLQGKLHVFMGSEDTFYLEGATRLLKQSLDSLDSDAVIEILPGRDHFTLFQGGLRARINQEMADVSVSNGNGRLQNRN
jgi:hypothetical protein